MLRIKNKLDTFFDFTFDHLNMDEQIIYDIYINKTAWYTIIGPMLIGALSAGLDKNNKDVTVYADLNDVGNM